MDNEEKIYIVLPEQSKWFIAKGESAESVSRTNPLCDKIKAKGKAYVVMPVDGNADEKPVFSICGDPLSKHEVKVAVDMFAKGNFSNRPSSGRVIATAVSLLLDLQEDDE